MKSGNPTKSILLSLCVPVLAAAIGYGPTQSQSGQAGIWAMVTAGVIGLLGAGAFAVPVGLAFKLGQPTWWVPAALGGMVLRMFITLVAAAVVMFATGLPKLTFGIWLMIFYFSLLIGETAVIVRVVRQISGQTPVGGAKADDATQPETTLGGATA